MKFLEYKYSPWSLKWFLQRTIIVFKERRLPQIGIFAGRKHTNFTEARPAKSRNYLNKFRPLSMVEVKIPEAQKQENLINTYFDRIYLLNLRHRSDKRLKSIYQLKKMGINAWIVDAIDGFQEPYRSEYEQYKALPLGGEDAHPLELKYNRKMITSPGGWGVLKSKKLIFLDALKNNYNRILVLQDDLFFIEDFHKKFEEFIKIIDEDWKVVGLGATQHVWNVPSCLFYTDNKITEYDPSQKFYFPLNTDGAFALGYDRTVFQELIDEIDKMNCSFDSGAVRAIYRNYRKKCFVSQPNLIIADVSTSDIRSGRNQADFSAKMKWDLPRYDCSKHEEELVSVIMPAYNAAETIEKSIRSVLMQTHRNLELIVADDGSTDGTADVVEKIAAEDARVRLLRNAENRGCYFVRNDALRASKGNYIAIQDADDLSLKDRLEKQMIPIVSGNALIVVGKIIRSNQNIEFFDPSDDNTLIKFINNPVQNDQDGDQEAFKKRPGLNTTMFHRSIFSEYGLFWENRFGSDAEIIERVIFKKTGVVQTDEEQTIHGHFSRYPALPEIYSVIDDVLLISPEMNRENLSNLYHVKGMERKEFRKKYREVLLGNADYQYPAF